MKKSTTQRSIAIAGTAAALTLAGTLIPGAAQAGPKVKFGSTLDATVQPSTSGPGLYCDPLNLAATCSFVMNEAYGRPDGGEKSPVTGTLKKVRVISGTAGSFQLQLVKARQIAGEWQAKVKATGPEITVVGQGDANWDNDSYRVEKFPVNMHIKKGWRLSMVSTKTSAVRCSSGGDNTLLYQPPLQSGSDYRNATGDDGCWPLIEGVVKQ